MTASMSVNTHVRKIQPALLVAMLVTYFLWPGRLSILNTSLPGAILAIATLIYLVRERRIDWRLFSVYAPFVLGVTAAACLAPDSPARDVLRPVVFGLISSYLFAYYTPRAPVFDYIHHWLIPVVCAFAVCLAALPFFPQLFAFGDVTSWLMAGMVERGLFFILTSVFLFLVSLRSRLALVGVVPLLVAIFIGVMLTSLRGIWLATVITLIAFAMLHRRLMPSLIVGAAFAAAFLFAQRIPDLTASALSPAAASALQMRINDLAVKSSDPDKPRVDFSNAGRLGYWVAGADMWRDHPWVGVGLGRFPDRSEEYAREASQTGDAEKSFDAHNTFVSILAETGILGFAGFLAMLGVAFYRSAQAWWSEPDTGRLQHSAVMALALGLTAVGLTWDVHLYRLWWISLGLAVGFSRIECRQYS